MNWANGLLAVVMIGGFTAFFLVGFVVGYLRGQLSIYRIVEEGLGPPRG